MINFANGVCIDIPSNTTLRPLYSRASVSLVTSAAMNQFARARGLLSLPINIFIPTLLLFGSGKGNIITQRRRGELTAKRIVKYRHGRAFWYNERGIPRTNNNPFPDKDKKIIKTSGRYILRYQYLD